VIFLFKVDIGLVIFTANEKQYVYVVGFHGTIVSKLHKCFFLVHCVYLERFINTRIEGKGFFAEKLAAGQRS